MSVVFQDPSTALNPRMTIQDILTDPLKIHGIGTAATRAAKVKDLLALVGPARTPPPRSRPRRSPAASASALPSPVPWPWTRTSSSRTSRPSALDVSVRAQVLNLLTDLKAQLNLGMVFISHDIQTVRYVSDRICVMYFGEIVEEGPADQVFDHPSNDYTKKLLGAAPSLLHP